MQPNSYTAEDRLVTEFIERVNRAGDGPAAREVYRAGFDRLRSTFDLYPVSGRKLGYIKSLPTADEIILRSIGAA